MERKKIIKELMHKPNLGFNELWGKQGKSNKFAYHMKTLEKEGLIKKSKKGYCLTHEGKRQATYIEGTTGDKESLPLIGVIVIVVGGDKVLMSKRQKEPFYGYWGFIGGKLNFKQYILECAREELMEESGLECDLELKGLFSGKTFNNEKLSYNHQMFLVKAINPRGKLIEETREGKNEWVNLSDVKNLKTFPNIPEVIKVVLGERFGWIEMDRYQENDLFVGKKVLREEKM